VSEALRNHALELAWRQWTLLGVAGTAPPPDQTVDLEALIAFTPFVTQADPRLEHETIDWCARPPDRRLSEKPDLGCAPGVRLDLPHAARSRSMSW
jgi:hypothetical protein